MSAPTQLTLALDLSPEPTLENFVANDHDAPLVMLRQLVEGAEEARGIGQLYLYGETGCGKTHLLRAARTLALSLGRPCFMTSPSVPVSRWPTTEELLHEACDSAALLAVDDCERLDDAQQTRLFQLYNDARDAQVPMLFAAACPSVALPLRDDLRTRLAWGMSFELMPLSDGQKLSLLQARARALGFDLHEDLGHYLLHHHSRDLSSLTQLLAELDRYSLATQRPVTLPLYRQWRNWQASTAPARLD